MKVIEFIEKMPMYGQQVIKITNNDEKNLGVFEFRNIPKKEKCLKVYGDKLIEHISSDTTKITYNGKIQEVDCILITMK